MNKKILLICLILSLNFNSVQACSLTDLGSCTFSDLKDFVLSLLSPSKKSKCENVYIPVCSKSQKTYDNICLLKEDKEKLDYYGRCLEYPHNLSANECVLERLNWNGYKCSEKEESEVYYKNEEFGFSLSLPSNSIIQNDFIELPKERNNTNLIFKKLEFVSKNYILDVFSYMKVKGEKETSQFKVYTFENSLDYGNEVLANIDYVYYVFEDDLGFLFSLYSFESSRDKYDKFIETLNFDKIMETLLFVEKSEDLKIPCEDYGDLNFDGVINKEDLDCFRFGSVLDNIQKKGDLNNDGVVDEKDEAILLSFINRNIDSFPICSFEKELKKGTTPKIVFNKNFNVIQNTLKTETSVIINFDILAEKGDVYVDVDGFDFEFLNNENVFVGEMVLNSGGEIKEDGYIFIGKGDKAFVSVEIKLRAKEKPIYTKVSLNKISYLDEFSKEKSMSTLIETNKFYLNYSGSNLICGNYGDVNNDGVIDEKDILLILENKELTENEKVRADVSGNGEVNVIDAIEIKKYVLSGEPFSICKKTFLPKVYENALIGVQKNSDKTNHVTMTFYIDSNMGDALIPSKVSFNEDDDTAGMYFALEKDGNIVIQNLKVWTSADLTKKGFLRIKKDVPNWVRIEFDVQAIKDTGLVNFELSKIVYLSDNERDYIYPLNIKTGDMFLKYDKKEFLSPCDGLGDLNFDGKIDYLDYDILKNNLNFLLADPDKFIYADLNRDGVLDEKDLKELDDYLGQRIFEFTGCKKQVNSLIDPVYTKDGYIYANDSFLKDLKKEVKCYINKDCLL